MPRTCLVPGTARHILALAQLQQGSSAMVVLPSGPGQRGEPDGPDSCSSSKRPGEAADPPTLSARVSARHPALIFKDSAGRPQSPSRLRARGILSPGELDRVTDASG
jgi:hypothetical protein